MTERSLQVTYRKGNPFSAYLHLSHQTGEKSARTVPSADGLLVVDYGHNGKAIGVEITAPSAVPLDRLNRVLADLGETPLSEQITCPCELHKRRGMFDTFWRNPMRPSRVQVSRRARRRQGRVTSLRRRVPRRFGP